MNENNFWINRYYKCFKYDSFYKCQLRLKLSDSINGENKNKV